MKSIELTGEIIKTNTPFAVPLDAAVVNITPVQSGSGDPSPTNVRPISGWTGAAVEVRGRNLLDPLGIRLTNPNQGTIISADRETGSIHFTYNPWDRYLGISIFTAGILTTKALKPGKYICSFDISGTITTTWSCGVRRVSNNVFQGSVVISASGHYSFQIDTSTWGAEDRYISWSRTGNQNTALDVTISNIILTPGTTEAAFEPYQSNQISVSFPTEAGTVYGGTLDVTTGLLTVTHGNIASYNGESLPGKWISSMDVYSAGGTPTTGAQVVYELATPQTYQLTQTQIALLAGENNVWADCGDIAIAYRPYHRFAFDGVNSIDNGVYVFPTDSMVAAPARQYTEQVVPGRSGVLLMDDGRYDNILHEYQVVTGDDGESNIALLRNMLASRVGYCRLTDTFDTDHYYMAVYNQNFTPVLEWRKRDMAKAVVSFYRKPQRFLLTGESAVVFTSSGSITNPTRFKSKPFIRVYGSGVLGIGNTNITIANHNYSYMDIDCETGRAYYGATSLDSKVTLNAIDFPALNPGSNGITKGSGITRIEITPRWWEL